ncbi:MAG: cupredoxin domain-containing protein [Candidatus Dormibacteria bacterium]
MSVAPLRRPLHRLAIPGAALGLGLLLAACGTGPIPGAHNNTSSSSSSSTSSGCTAASAKSTVTIDATNALKFVPDTACLKASGTITWKNVGNITHTTTDDVAKAAKASDALLPKGASPWSHTLPGGASFSLKLTVPGKYKYFCIPHETLGMLGSITVVK